MRQLKITNSITSRNFTSIQKYLVEVNRIPVLTVAEELAMCERIVSGDKVALELLVKSNLRFVISVAKRYEGHGLVYHRINSL